MNSVQTSLYTAAIALCVFSAGILRGKKSEGSSRSFFFTAFLTIEALIFVCELLMAHPATPLKGLWLALRMALSLSIAPCLWLVIRETLETNRPKLADLGWMHGAAMAAGLLLLIPLVSAAHLGTDYPDPHRPASWLYSKIIHTGMLGCIGIFAVQVPWYLRRSQQMLLGHARAPKWLHLPLAVVFTAWLLGLLRTLQCISHAPRELNLVFAFAEVGVTVGAIYLVVRHGGNESDVLDTALPKYARSKLDAATIERIKRKLATALEKPEVYGDSLLNLRSLSRTIGEKAHYVSQVINQDLNATFYELVSRSRIERAKKLLADAPEQTVLEIALAVGFNAKSTFNTAFRRYAGMTPTEFRAKSE